ncbi:autotransporter-associated N-terminal domain-containing protein [Fusobacterium periodonticum]|uniref:Outer membrane protein n=1 Tax=Fusobacterium periodonticum 1_1_41FAA TaxID=469621 RepID=D6LJ17_9FUSO|nr:autotransporter-associated N-terminal domain-containing protein [Fusobacterium periodonticum]EFG28393.1 autotransporter beta-domain protein [Fusobacterium periodonticum 1_1_41FAA]
MGNNNLQTTEKNLRSIAKRYENVKYSVGLAVLFLMKGTSAFSDDNKIQELEKQKDILTDAKKEKAKVKETKKIEKVSKKLKASWANIQFGANDLYSNFFATPKTKVDKASIVKNEKTVLVASADNSTSLPMLAKLSSDIEKTSTPTTEEINTSKGNLRNSVGNLQEKINNARTENAKEVQGLKLELVQLMEQGNQVVKSPWSSWQFGANYFYDNWGSAYKGRGDKIKNIGVIEREVDVLTGSISKSSNKYAELNITKRENPYKLISVKEVNPPVKDFKFSPVFSLRKPTKLEALKLDIKTISPEIPATFKFSINTPVIPTINPAQVNIETVELRNYGNVWNMGIVGRQDPEYKYSLFTIPSGTYNLNSDSKSIDGVHSAPTVVDMSIIGQNVKVENGTVLNINKVGGRAVSIDINPGWQDGGPQWPETSSTFTNEGTINLNAINTAAIEAQTETTSADYYAAGAPASTNHHWIHKKEIYGINKGIINGNNSKQVAMTFVREQVPGREQQFLTNAASGTITMNGAKSMAFSFNVDDLYAEAKNEGKIILNGINNYGFAFGKQIANNHLKENSIISNETTGTIEVNGDNSGGFALQEMIDASKNPYIKNINITNKGKININSKESFGMYSEQMTAKNTGEINIIENSTKSIGLYATKKNTVTTELINEGKINLKTKNDSNIGLFTDNAKVINDKDGEVNILKGENIGALISGTGVGENLGKISGVADGSIGILTKDTGSFINKGKITVNAKASSTNKGAIGIFANTGSSFTNPSGKLDINVSGKNSVGVYSKGAVKLGKASVSAADNAINFFADANGNIEFEAGKTVTSTTKSGALLFYDGNSNGKIKLVGDLKATIEGGNTATERGTAFSYKSSSASTNGSITGYNNGLSYGSFTPGEVQTFFDNLFGTGATGSSTLNKLELTMKPGSRLFISPNVKAKISQLVTDNLFSGITGAPVISPNSSDDYVRNLLLKSELELDRAVNLDSASETYNKLEISNSSIINNSTISGTKDKQYAMVQENDEANRAYVTLLNNQNKEINLAGKDSLAMYAKNGYIINKGRIELSGTGSTAIYGKDNTLIKNTNTSKIKLNGDKSAAIYYNNTDTASTGENIENYGEIELNGSKDTGIAYNSVSIPTTNPTLVKNFADIKINGSESIGIHSEVTQSNPYVIENQGNITITAQTQDIKKPAVGIHTKDSLAKIINGNNGNIKVSKNNIAILGTSVDNQGNIEVDTAGTAIYSKGGTVNLQSGDITLKGGSQNNETKAVILNGTNQTLNRVGGNINSEDYSHVIVNTGSGNTINLAGSDVVLKNNSIYAYSNDKNSKIYNNVNLKFDGTRGENLGIYSNGLVENYANIDLRKGYGNIGIYSYGSKAKNTGIITVGASDIANDLYNIGMASGFTSGHSPRDAKDTVITPKYTGEVENAGTINVNGKGGIGLFSTGRGSVARNTGNIILNNDDTIGIYADEGATVYNSGTIRTGRTGLKGVQGIVLGVGSKLHNTGNIIIDADNAAGVKLKGGTITLEGNIIVTGAGSERIGANTTEDMSLNFSGLDIKHDKNTRDVKIYKDNKLEKPKIVSYKEIGQQPRNVDANSIGLYFNTSGEFKQNPIRNLAVLTDEADFIIGAEAAKRTTSKYIEINDPQMLKPYRETIMYNPRIRKWNTYSGSLTWIATSVLDSATALPEKVYLAKIPYTTFAGDEAKPVAKTDTYNFLDGLEQRYGVEKLGTKENQLFQKLNSIGNNEEVLFYQAIDEMMGHQYANTQQRVEATGNILDKEFNYLRNEWSNPSKDSNKVKTFGARGEYKTNTEGVIDYKNNAYGVAYVHEDETVKLGESTGWYTGIVHNTFKFKDIGNSKEEQLQGKLGIFKSVPFDHNNGLNWTISGDIFAGYNKMNRKFLVVDEVFNAKGKYHTYGLGLKNELSGEFRLSEGFSIKPYVAIGLEYGRVSKIKEKSGEMKLKVKSNDYFSIRPEIGAELGFKHHFDRKTVRVGVSVAYENELGRVANGKNKAKVAGTDADWFNIRGEKEDRLGNIKSDLNLGWDNQVVGVTANVGYDTKGHNVRGGVGLRVIF